MQKTANKVLFFGLRGCHYSEKAEALLRTQGFDVLSASCAGRSDRLPQFVHEWSGDYILSFRTYFILPKRVLDRVNVAAVNFHPAPPDYPGTGCISWALYEGASTFGVTAHLMTEVIDNGPIVECRRFSISESDNVASLLSRTQAEAYQLFSDTVSALSREGRSYIDRKISENSREHWRGKARRIREVDALQRIDVNCSREHLERVIRATYTEKFPPFVEIHGRKFYFKP